MLDRSPGSAQAPRNAERFRLVEELGRGGMGIVHRAIDTARGDQEVALKVIRQQGAITPEQRLRFKEEFRAMAKLQHPNTLKVFDFGQVDEQTQFLTMEIAPGRELSARLQDGPIPPAEAFPILIQLLQALGFIHSRGFVHRDVKAENIRVADDGSLKLMDFGLIAQLGVPATGKITGTVQYLAPEVARGGSINAATDLYAVGCLAYRMLCGRFPYEGTPIEVVRAHVEAPIVPPRALRPELAAPLEAIVLRLLAKDQASRYQEAVEVIAALSDLAGVRVARESLAQLRSYLTSSTLVGRERELSRLEASLSDAVAGRGRAVFVGAPAGIGKSRLINELVLQAKLEDRCVLQGQCLESGMAPYEAIAQALRPLVALSSPAELAPFASVLARLLPELEDRGYRASAGLEPNQERLRLNEAIFAWLSRVSARLPLVLYLEDLHWCDPSSLEVLNHCIRHADASRLLLLASFRDDEAPHSSPIWFTIEEGRTLYLRLGPLNLAQTLQLLQAMLRELRIGKDFGQYLHSVTGGNAFFLTEVLRYLMEADLLRQQDGAWHFPPDVSALALPTTVGATITRRLDQLSPQALALARVAAVVGRYQTLATLHAVAGLEEEPLFKALDELIDRQFILKEEQRYTFPHDWVRETLYGTTPEDVRRELHERCAAYLERAHADAASIVNELAHHYGRGRDRRKAFAYLRLAGDQAKAAGIIGSALEHWEQADALLPGLDLPDKEAIQAELWWIIGSSVFEFRPARAIEAFEKLIPLLEARGDVDAVCGVLKRIAGGLMRLPTGLRDRMVAQLSKSVPYHHRAPHWHPVAMAGWVQRVIESYGLLGAAYGYVGQPARGLAFIERALHLLPFKDTPLEGALLVAKGSVLFAAGRMDGVVDACQRAQTLLFDRDLRGNEPVQAARVGASGYYNARCFQGIRPDEALLEDALRAAEEIQAHGLKNLVWTFRAVWCAWTGRTAEALSTLEEVGQNSRNIGAPPYNWALYVRPFVAYLRGELAEARALIRLALDFSHLDQEAFAEQSLHVLLGHLHVEAGELEPARAVFDAVEGRSRADGMALITIQVLLGQGRLALAEARFADAVRLLSEAEAMAESGPSRNPLHQGIALRLLGETHLAIGETEQARGCFERALAIAVDPMQLNLMEEGHVHRGLGELERALDNPAGATACFERAAECYRRLDNPHHLARVTRRLAELRAPLSAGVPAEAKASLSPETRWHAALLGQVTLGLSDEGYLQAALAACLEGLAAEEATLFALDPELCWVASRNRDGACGELPTNPDFLAQVLAEGQGRMALDVPSLLEVDMGSNLELEIPSVLIAPVRSAGEPMAVLYLAKRDLVTPFDEPDLVALTGFCRVLAAGLERRREGSGARG